MVQGMLMMTPAKCGDASSMARLWVHECLRVFHDRLVSDTDRSRFQNIMEGLLQSRLPGLVLPEEVLRSRPLLFADFALPGVPPSERVYEEIHDTACFARSLEGYLAEYNAAAASPLTLVFFQDAMNHVARIGMP
jgi:dynein heavy chain, axonemal